MASNRALHRQEVETALQTIEQGGRPRDVESQTPEFKEAKPPGATDRDRVKHAVLDIAHAAACFANAVGGTVVVGLRDDTGGPGAFVGVPDELQADELRHRIYQATTPNLVVDVEERQLAGTRVLVVGVAAGFDLHRVGGKLSERIGTSCQPMSPTREARVLEERRSYDWSAEQSERGVVDVSALAIEEARRLLAAAGDDQSLRRATLATPDLLRECGVLDQRDTLNRAGAILFCEGSAEAPPLTIQYLRKRSGGGSLSRPPADLRTPMVVAIAEVLELIDAINETTPVTLRSGVQQQLETIPRAAVREAVVNAVAHRDYRLPEQIVIEHTPQTLVVTSPGELVFGVTEDNIITHISKPRNRTLSSALAILHLAERAGTGVDLMVRSMIRAGHRPPQFQSRDEHVRVLLNGGTPVARIAALIAELPEELRDDTDAILVIHYLRNHPTTSATAISHQIQKSDEEAEEILRRLADDQWELIEPTAASRKARKPSYRLRARVRAELGSLLPYHRNLRDETERRVIAHLHEYGTISNQTARNLFQVEVVRASVMLRELADRELIQKTSDSPERGPTVRYEPGSRFPRRRTPRGSRGA